MAEITQLMQTLQRPGGFGLHIQSGQRHINGRPTSERIAWFVGTVPASLYYVEGATPEEIAKGAKFGATFGPQRRYFPSTEAAWTEAERQGFARCDLPECCCNTIERGK